MRAKVERLERIVKSSLPCSCRTAEIEWRETTVPASAPPARELVELVGEPARCERCGRPQAPTFVEVILREGSSD